MIKRISIFLSLVALLASSSTLKAQAETTVIDKIIAVVGENSILYSDVENQFIQYTMQGSIKDKSALRCQIFEELLFSKLLLNQALIDSVEVSPDQVESEMDRRLQYFIMQIGSKEELEKYYNKSVEAIKSDLRSMIHDQLMMQNVREEITKDIKITPSEVRDYFKQIPNDSIPLIESELQYQEIVLIPKVTDEEKQFAYEKLQGIRDRILKGEDFATLARIYSEDPGSALKGGELGDFTRGVMYPEFEAAAFALQPDQMSQIVETEAGYHILKLIKRKGEYINVRHILILKKVSQYSVKQIEIGMDTIYTAIQSGKITFDDAAKKYSMDDMAVNGGIALNANSGSNFFKPDELDQDYFYQLDKLDVGQISKPFAVADKSGKQKIVIVKLMKQTEAHKANLNDDYDFIQEAALNNKKEKAVSAWIKEKTSKTYIMIVDPAFKGCNFMYDWN